jgi:hypothetical protein
LPCLVAQHLTRYFMVGMHAIVSQKNLNRLLSSAD